MYQDNYSKEFPKDKAESSTDIGWETLSVLGEKEVSKANPCQAAYLNSIKW